MLCFRHVHSRRLCQAHFDQRYGRLVRQPSLPLPAVVAVAVGLLELLGGIAILIGFQTRIAAIALAVFTLAATAVAHPDFADQVQLLFFQKNLAIAGGLFVLAVFGAGARRTPSAVDRLILVTKSPEPKCSGLFAENIDPDLGLLRAR